MFFLLCSSLTPRRERNRVKANGSEHALLKCTAHRVPVPRIRHIVWAGQAAESGVNKEDSGTADGIAGEAMPDFDAPNGILSKQDNAENIQSVPLSTQLWGADPPDHKCGYVAIVGRPNAGKSTLMNFLVGTKLSIVTYKPQTTRHRVLGLVSDDSCQMVLLDTPGVVDEKRNKMERVMMSSVASSLKDADVVLVMVDAAGKTPKLALEGLLPAALLKGDRPIVLALNKVDLLREEEAEELYTFYKREWRERAEVLCISAKEGKGVEPLLYWLKQQLPCGPSLYPKDVLSEHPERFFIAEIVREQIFLQYRQEVPYAASVKVTEYTERKGQAADLIRVEITVDRESQKGILIGKGGTAMKKLATAARLQVQEFVGKKIFLQTQVKVSPGWMEDERALNSAGLQRTNVASSDLS
mmetsp:Transcript_2027/g.4133  ORF Transcript_2027/g.4133 Transcript_2027/m.4133 type:complete len:413 (+) Transcript_2027:516-1754(+)